MPFYITEGGNLALRGVSADTIDLSKVSRADLVKQLIELLAALNSAYYSKYKDPLWRDVDLENNKILSGSSKQFFNISNIADKDFVQVKPKVGDIDVMIDKNKKSQLLELFSQLVDKKVGPATFLGNSLGNEQTSSLWSFANPKVNVQMDFEFVPFDGEGPTEWAEFSHSSSWEDMQRGIKGVFHKLLVRSLTAATEKPFFLRKKSGRTKASPMTDTMSQDSMYSFAVSSKDGGGLRPKYEAIIDPITKSPEVKDGLPVYKKLYTSPYEKKLTKILELLLGSRLQNTDISKVLPYFWSFSGLVRIMNSLLNEEEKQKVADKFIERVIGSRSQRLYRTDSERDLEEKLAALRYFYSKLGLQPPPDFNQQLEIYKQNDRSATSRNVSSDINIEKILETAKMNKTTLQKFIQRLKPLLKEASPEKKAKALKLLEAAKKEADIERRKDTSDDMPKSKKDRSAYAIDPETRITFDFAKQHYPLAKTPEEAFVKFVQRSLKHSKEDAELMNVRMDELNERIDKLEKVVKKMGARKTEIPESTDYKLEK